MRILCAKSGIHFQVEHFSAYLDGRETHHPIFDIPQKVLLQYIRKWASNEMTETDSYLYYLALLNSTSLVQWRVPAQKNEHTKSVVANNMDYLVRVIAKMNCITSLIFKPAIVAISPETKTLENSIYWIDMWNSAVDTFVYSYASAFADERLKERITKREAILEKLINDPNKPQDIIANHLAEWACDAGEFPDNHYAIHNGKKIPLSEHWKNIIRACVKNDAIFSIDSEDLLLLIEYCEDNVDAGSIYGYKLFEYLRMGKDKKIAYNEFADMDLQGMPKFRILDASASVEDANKLAMIDSAPLELPMAHNYPDKISYLRAKAKFDLARSYNEGLKKASELGNGEAPRTGNNDSIAKDIL